MIKKFYYLRKVYQITYNSNNADSGSVPIDNNYYTDGQLATVLGNTSSLVKTGYTFSNWNTLANGTGTSYDPGDEFTISLNTILYAQWNVNSYTITVLSNNSSYGSTTGSGTFNYGTSTQITATPASGYEFVKWNDDNTSLTRTITVTGNATYIAYFLIKRYNIVLSTNGNALDAYVVYNGNTYAAGTTFTMLPNETCTVYTLPKYDTWNGITSSYRLPFMGFTSNYGAISNLQTLSTEYITSTYTADSYDDTISLFYGTVGRTTANILVGFPQVKSSNTSPFVDTSALYAYINVSTSQHHIKGSGYFISNSDMISDSSNVIEANYLWDHSTHYNWTTKTNNLSSAGLSGANVFDGAWGTNTPITVSITIPSGSPYEFVKWKIDRMDTSYIDNLGGSGIYHIYQDNFGNYGNDYFEKYYNTIFTQTSCSIPWPGCHVQITPILKLKTS